MLLRQHILFNNVVSNTVVLNFLEVVVLEPPVEISLKVKLDELIIWCALSQEFV